MAPAASRGKCCDLLDRCFGYGRDIRPQPLNVRYRSLPVVEEISARWARSLLNRKPCYRPAARAAPLVAAVSWEHVVVEDQGIGAGLEQIGQPHLGWFPVCVNVVELVVLGNGPTRRECSDPRGHRSEERRVGKECVSTCRYRGSPDNEQKNQT